MYVPLHYTKREFSRKVNDTFMMLVPVQTSDGSCSNLTKPNSKARLADEPSEV